MRRRARSLSTGNGGPPPDRTAPVPSFAQGAPVAAPLVNKVNATGLAAYSGQESLYCFEAVAGEVLSIMTLGRSGDVSLYASHGSEPAAAAHGFKSMRAATAKRYASPPRRPARPTSNWWAWLPAPA
ncbi:MAG: hypothetical protein ABWZ08_00550 [Pseudoxanthomonas sp.]